MDQPRRIGPLPGGAAADWLIHQVRGQTLVIAPTEESAGLLFDDIQALERRLAPDTPTRAAFFSEDGDERAVALSRWARQTVSMLIIPRPSLHNPVARPESFAAAHRRWKWGDRVDRDTALAHLLTHGYERVDTVERSGEWAVRGEVVDLWSPGWEGPLRLLWPFDQIESIRKIDPPTQRSTDAVDLADICPVTITAPPETAATLLDYLGPEGTLFEFLSPSDPHLEWSGPHWVYDPLSMVESPLPYEPAPAVAGDKARLGREIRSALDRGWTVEIYCHNPGEQERLEEILLEHDRTFAKAFENKTIDLPLGPLARGFADGSTRRLVLANGELFGRVRRRWRWPSFIGQNALANVAELRQGDFVVHEQYGIGRYVALERKKAGGLEADYLRLEYRGGDRLFVPLFEFKQVRKYVGAEGKRPVLSSLDTHTWDTTRAEVETAVAQLARDLLARAARRSQTQGFAFPSDSHLEEEFGASFLYTLTPDQARAIEETRRDMMNPLPMDRLVCGDVGYGKTEVAMRAAFKAVCAGKQVAVLAPTTILAEQHARNFRQRFADYPVQVAVLSRFTQAHDLKTALADLRTGAADIAVGTHRLLSADVAFKDLGLVVIDEEHRFGVKQKEKIRAFRDVVDVLALSATPIPRTLGQALGGIKGLSVIETPPEGRLPIGTHVGPFDPKMAMVAVEQELRRGGQVFYVHNRVKTIEERRRWLTEALQEHGLSARIALAHGKMSGPELEKIMWEFLHRRYDILLATSIIESGLDIPTVNTLVVEEAEDFGLAQLYQLRGRVGRERQKAYCFLFYSDGATLTEESQKRLSALQEFASLGSGFKLAMRDLEIRGAGNLLGPQQHGYVNAVGLDLYGQLLTEEIERQKTGGEAPSAVRRVDPSIDLPVSAFLPEDYLPSEADRILFYKRLLDAPPDTLEKLAEELEDRCGRRPDPARRLFDVAHLRQAARERGVTRVELVNSGLELRFDERVVMTPAALDKMMGRDAGRLSFLPGPPFGMRWEEPLPADLVTGTTDIIRSLEVSCDDI